MTTLRRLSACLALITPPGLTQETHAPQATVEAVKMEGVQPLHRVGSVWLAGQPDAAALERLILDEEIGVRLVLDLRRAAEPRGFDEATVVEELGAEYVSLGFGGASDMTDDIFANVRSILSEEREGAVLVHCSSSQRVGAVWVAARVLDQGVPWDTAVEEARRIGLRSTGHEEKARFYVQGGGSVELGLKTEEIRQRFPEVPRTSIVQLQRDMASERPPILIDARSAEEYAISHLKGALHMDSPAARQALEASGKPSEEGAVDVVVYCSVGWRSAEMVQELQSAGPTGARNLEGSIFAWANSGRPVYRGGERVFTVHPFDAEWGRLLAAPLREPLTQPEGR